MINLFEPSVGRAEISSLTKALNSHWLGKGARVAEFEAVWAAHVGVPVENMVSTNSCTSALFEAVRLAGIGTGDEVIIPTIHFVGAAQAVIAAGGTPVFCDVDKWTMSATTETIHKRYSMRTKAVILNHYGGNLCQIERGEFPDKIIWIDDMACAQGAQVIEGSDFSTWSFDPMKIVVCGNGGALYCKDPDETKQARQDFTLGIDSESGFTSENERWWEYKVTNPGRSWNVLIDMEAAIGLEQLKKIDGFIERRREISCHYISEFQSLSQSIDPSFGPENYYFFWMFTKWRDELARHLRAHDIYTTFKYHPLHLAYNTGDSLPNAEWAAEHALLLPLHNNLTDADVEYVCEKVKEFFENGE